MTPFGATVGISAPLRLRLRYAPIPTILRTPPAGALAARKAHLKAPVSDHRSSSRALSTPNVLVNPPASSRSVPGLVRDRQCAFERKLDTKTLRPRADDIGNGA